MPMTQQRRFRRQPLTLLLLLCLQVATDPASASDAANQAAGITYLRVASASSAETSYENYCAYADPRVAHNLSASYRPARDSHPLVDLYPSDGCKRANATTASTGPSYAGKTLVVARGGCSYSEKAVHAYAQGAAGLLVVSTERYLPYLYVESPLLPSYYPVAVVSKVAYQSFKAQFLASTGGASGGLYRPLDDNSTGSKQYMFLALYAIALVTMVMSCVAAATALRQHLLTRARISNLSLNSGNNTELDAATGTWWQNAIFIAVVIAVPVSILLLLNFAYDYFVWVMLVLYGYSVASSLVYYANRIYLLAVQSRLETGPRPWLATALEFDLGKCCGKVSYTYLEFFVYPVGLAVAIVWFVFRNSHWAFILTDLLNVILVMRVIESLALVLRIKVATIMLCCFLVYDVFFVFITPLFSGGGGGGGGGTPSPTAAPPSRVRRDTVMDYYIDRGGSIMERVALGTAGMSGEIIPIVFKVMPYPPAESILTCLLPYSILGLGDVILPAILCSLNLFFDLAWSNRCWPYFLSSLVGYLLGLATCAAVLFATGKGQPALLYIVPLILIASYLCAAVRRELKLYFHCALPDEYRMGYAVDLDGNVNNSANGNAGGGPTENGGDGGPTETGGGGGPTETGGGGGSTSSDARASGRTKLLPGTTAAAATELD